MNCPKCFSEMEKITYESIDIERCVACKGMWFEMLKLQDLKEINGSQSIDVGDAKVGKLYNEIVNIDSPKCHVKMLRMVDKQQHHIWYESCPTCYGVFLDAGEFTDYKEDTLLDYFKDLITGERD